MGKAEAVVRRGEQTTAGQGKRKQQQGGRGVVGGGEEGVAWAKGRRGCRGRRGGVALLGRGVATGREWTEGKGGERTEESGGFDTGGENDRMGREESHRAPDRH